MSQSNSPKVSAISDKVKEIMAGNTKTVLEESKRLGKELAEKDLTKSQIRNIYSIVKRISAGGEFGVKQKHELKLLIPKIEYAVARGQGEGWKDLGEMLSKCIEQVETGDHFRFFAEFFEAIVAYHYSYSEQKKQEKRHHAGGR